MNLNELIDRLTALRRDMEGDGRDCDAINVYAHGRAVNSIEMEDDGSSQDNLDVQLKS